MRSTLSHVGIAADDKADERPAHHLIEEKKSLPARTAVDVSIRPFTVDVSEEQLSDLHRRIAATRWPTKELVTDRSQGAQLATIQALARYWTTDYDWRRCEATPSRLPTSCWQRWPGSSAGRRRCG